MITQTNKISNNQFQVTFDFTPDDVTRSRDGANFTHKASGRNDRQGIWEGVELIESQTKIGNNAWVKHGTNKSVTVSTSDNGVQIQGWAKYRIKTMGFHFKDKTGKYPFFWYGNISGVEKKYEQGYFTDSSAATPTSKLYDMHAVVPTDWKHTSTAWSDWAYNHGKNTSNWHKDSGRYEQRNGNYESANSSNGWIALSGRGQAYRKSCMFTFEKEFSISVNSSGIVKDASTPELTIHPAKGDSGEVTLKYIDKNNCNGRVWLRAYCKDKQVDIDNYNSSGHFSNGSSWKYKIDFNHWFGEAYRGNDVYYEAWAKNDYGKESAGTGRKGIHRYNGRPSIPNGLSVKGKNNLIYDSVNMKWNASSDPDGDSLVYDLWLKIESGTTVYKDDYIYRGKAGTNYDYSISNYPDDTNFTYWVRSSDNLLTSDWSEPYKFRKGSKPTNELSIALPINNSTLFNSKPRFIIKDYDGSSTINIQINNDVFKSPSDCFDIRNHEIIFKPNKEMIQDKNKITLWLSNEYGEGAKQEYTFNYKKADLDPAIEDKYIYATIFNNIIKDIELFSQAYNEKSDISKAEKDSLIKAKDYNQCVSIIQSVNSKLNNFFPNKFAVQSDLSNVVSGQTLTDDKLWDKLMIELTRV